MIWNKANKTGRPSTFWKNEDGPITPKLSKLHDHEFGQGYDIYYQNSSGKTVASMHGLTKEEGEFLKMKWKL